MLSRRSLLATVAILSVVGCGSSPSSTPAASPSESAAPTGEVVVYAPGALAAHTKKLAAAYAEEGRGTVSFEVGHTPVQREQLAKGAAPDVWIAANPADMKVTAEKQLVAADGVKDLATTGLVVVVAPDNPGNVKELTDLSRPGVKVLLAADTLPIWKTTSKTFEKVEQKNPGFTQAVLANTVSRELGVQPIVQKVQLGEADAGVVFVTDVPDEPKGITTVEVPADVDTRLTLQVAPVTAGKNPDGAAAFIDFVTTGRGREVLTKAGYQAPAS